MAVTGSTLLLRVTPASLGDGSWSNLLLDVRRSTTTPPHLLLDVTQAVGVLDQLVPSQAQAPVLQRCWPEIEVTIRGTTYTFTPADFTSEDVVLQLKPEGKEWSWSFSDVSSSSTRTNWLAPRVGWEIQWGTVPPGVSPWTYILKYKTPSGVELPYVLMAQGITKSSSADPVDTHVISLKGVGARGRWDRARVSLQLDSEHGWTNGRIAKYVIENAEDPDGNKVVPAGVVLFGEEVGQPLVNPVDVDCEFGLDVAEEVLDAVNLQLYEGADASGNPTLEARPKAPVDGQSTFTVTEAQVLKDAGFDVSIDADTPTCLVVEASKVDDSAGDGDVTTTTIELTYDTFAVEVASFLQLAASDPGGPGLSAVSASAGDPFLQLKERKVTRKTTRNGCISREEVTVEGYKNPVAARYLTTGGSTDLTFDRVSTVYVKDPDAQDLDEAEAYLWERDRWSLLSLTIRHFGGLDSKSFYRGRIPRWIQEAFQPGNCDFVPPVGTDFPVPWTETLGEGTRPSGVVVSCDDQLWSVPEPYRDFVGRQIHEVVFEGGWWNSPNALKFRAGGGTDWTTVNYTPDVFLTGSKQGVQFAHEAFFSDNVRFEAGVEGPGDDVWRATHHNVAGTEFQAVSAPYSYEKHERWLKTTFLKRNWIEAQISSEDEGGWLTRERDWFAEWNQFPGGDYLFGGETTGRDRTWRNLKYLSSETKYEAEGNLNHGMTQSEFEVDGKLKPDFPKEFIGLEGYLPAMPVCNRDLAQRENTVPLRVVLCIDQGEEAVMIHWEDDPVTVDWAETEEVLERYAKRLFRELTAITAKLPMLPDARLIPLRQGTFDFPRRGYSSRTCWVASNQITRTRLNGRGLVLSEVELKVPVITDS